MERRLPAAYVPSPSNYGLPFRQARTILSPPSAHPLCALCLMILNTSKIPFLSETDAYSHLFLAQIAYKIYLLIAVV